jgi:hypothetical protein
MKAVLFDGTVEGDATAVALYDPHGAREYRTGTLPVEAFQLLRALDHGALALLRWHAPRAWRVAVTTEPPPAHSRALWRRLEDHWIEVGPSGMAVLATVDHFADPEGDGDDEEDRAAPEAVVPLSPGRYRVARYDRRALVGPVDEGFETLFAGEPELAEPGSGARQESRDVAMVFTLSPIAPGDATPRPQCGGVRAWQDAIEAGDFDTAALSARLSGGPTEVGLALAALAEMGTPDAIAALRRAARTDDPRVLSVVRVLSRAYHLALGIDVRRGGGRG